MGDLIAILRDVRPDLEIGDGVGPLLSSIVEQARAAFPDVDHPAELFVAHLATKLVGDSAESALQALHTDDLFLAGACAAGSKPALAAFERTCLPAMDRAVARLRGGAEIATEVRQIVRLLVLVPRPNADRTLPPRIADFSGRSRLSGWLSVIGVREAVRILRRERREIPSEGEELARALGEDSGPELDYFRQIYQAEFRASLAEAIEQLPDRQKMLLRQNVLDGVSIDRLAAVHHVHRATVARWLVSARQTLLASTKQSLLGRLQVSPSELESILRLIRSQLHVSLRALFAEDPR